jgi:hypothetical protein
MPQADPQPFIVLGAPRSGTSMVAGALHACGIRMGSDFLESDSGNPHGYFEDLDFINFHRKLLAHSAASSNRLFEDTTMREAPFDFKPTSKDLVIAKTLINQRTTINQPWGWKDPRTCLFLPFWIEKLPKARFIAVYKHPLESSASLLRMGKNWDLALDPTMAVRSWTFYMSEILKFLHNLPKEQYFITNTNALIHNSDALIARLQKWLKTDVETSSIKQQIVAKLTTKSMLSPEIEERFKHHFPQAAKIYDDLQEYSGPTEESLESSNLLKTSNLSTEGFCLDEETELAYLQNRLQPSAARRNNLARGELRQRVVKHMHTICIHENDLNAHCDQLGKAYNELNKAYDDLNKAYDGLSKAYDALADHTKSLKDQHQRIAQDFERQLREQKNATEVATEEANQNEAPLKAKDHLLETPTKKNPRA